MLNSHVSGKRKFSSCQTEGHLRHGVMGKQKGRRDRKALLLFHRHRSRDFRRNRHGKFVKSQVFFFFFLGETKQGACTYPKKKLNRGPVGIKSVAIGGILYEKMDDK